MNSLKSRRNFLENIGVVALIVAGSTNSAFALATRGETTEWANKLRLICEMLLNREISPEQWQDQVSRLYDAISLTDIFEGLDFEAVRAGMDTTRPGGHWNSSFYRWLEQY